MTRFSDLEIAEHSIMIEGLPKDMPRERLEEKILAAFKSLAKGAAVYQIDSIDGIKSQISEVDQN